MTTTRVLCTVSLAAWLTASQAATASAQSADAGPAQTTGADAAPSPAAGPPLRIFPRPGNFFLPPAGAGYYSLMDQLRRAERPAAPRSGYPSFAIMAPAFYDADFRYLDSVPADGRRPFERLKRVRIGESLLFSTGGAAWYRFHDEANSRLTRVDQTYSLGRVRAYGDISYRDRIRVYAELITAGRSGGDLPALAVDSNHADLLNAFADVKLFDHDSHPAYVRVGGRRCCSGRNA
jgi:hypothetical protein